jgi:type III pantothenate kinase
LNLIIDIGNSQTKVAVFDKGDLIHSICFDVLTVTRVIELKQLYRELKQVILSSVATINNELLVVLKNEFDYFIHFNHQTPVPLENLYQSKETLGLDRLAAAVGGVELFPGKKLLIIDAGTAITFDLVNEKSQFLGGNISPGLKMRFQALHKFTSHLPADEVAEPWPEIGKTTKDAIRAGVQNGMIFEIEGMIDHILKDWQDCLVILTGGDSFFFDKKLKNTIFVKFEITLIGLNRILEYNAEKN